MFPRFGEVVHASWKGHADSTECITINFVDINHLFHSY